jgi:hypothetical protein
MLKVIKDVPDSEEAWEYYSWLGSASGMRSSFPPLILQ